jgi:hypothetical protein
MGIVTLGIAVSGVAYIITFDQLTQSKGFLFALRVIGCIALAISLASSPALLSGTSVLKVPRKVRKLFDATAWRDPLFLVFTASGFCCFLGYIALYFFIPTYATGSSWDFTIVRALHPSHVDCWIVLRTSAQWISGTEAGAVLATASS